MISWKLNIILWQAEQNKEKDPVLQKNKIMFLKRQLATVKLCWVKKFECWMEKFKSKFFKQAQNYLAPFPMSSIPYFAHDNVKS